MNNGLWSSRAPLIVEVVGGSGGQYLPTVRIMVGEIILLLQGLMHLRILLNHLVGVG